MGDRGPAKSARSGRRLGALVVACLAAGAVAAWAWFAWPSPGSARRKEPLALALDSPHRNARPGVRFLGDAACARCHAEIAKTFREHPMGRSMAPTPEATWIRDALDAESRTFRAEGFEYAVERRGDRVVHRETRRDDSGRVVAEYSAEVRYAIGSGSQGVTFAVDRGGYLVQSPISWYSQSAQWDLAPGYRGNNLHFERPIPADCLFCHANRVEPVEDTLNRYREPIFRGGHAIGCERCHGPGELHAKSPRWDGEEDPNIVNPARLEPSLRENVCEQCHLEGAARVARAGRDPFDYRPGLPLDEFLTVFVKAKGPGVNKAVGHVEQMHESRCYLASGGKLGCISCHDPHERPAESEKAAYFRGRCFECHADRGCSLPREERLARSPDDSCIQCHMPARPISDIAHTASTLHRIPRRAEEESSPDSGALSALEPGQPPLVPFHRERAAAPDRESLGRDLAIALCLKGRTEPDRSLAAAVGRMALPLLDASLKSRPDDPPAWEAKASVLFLGNRFKPALEVLEDELKRFPRSEEALDMAAGASARLSRLDEGLDFARRLVAVNPERSANHVTLGRVQVLRNEWPAAAESCRRALQLNPADLATRRALIVCYLKLGEKSKALAELDTLLAFDPPDRDELRRLAEGER